MNEETKQEEQYKYTLDAINKIEKECAFLKKCLLHKKTKDNLTEDFIISRTKIIQSNVDDIPFNFFYDTCIRGSVTDYVKIAKEFAKCLLGV